ncbi:hypothetical protein [Bradyrhizobium japonicum]|uniref:hypothetical protein n=1 Tax=Bradyrhizobium japonicum TaxID=375 RepID=UPI001BADDBD8|nr:hypothetical protein [Bradyrhizobium japonicum]MBR0959473.1 hypothetical protein [Bradyrhizobium japonicum]
MLDQLQSMNVASIKQVGWRNCPEPLRLALAAVHTKGPAFRRQILGKAINPIAAPPFEVGLDPRPVVYLAWQLEERETRYRSICAGLVTAAIAAYFAAAPPFAFFVLFIIAAGYCGFHNSRIDTSPERFSKGRFNLATADELLSEGHAKELDFGVSPPNQRVIVHKNFNPFGSLGISTGKWAFTVDVGRPANTASGRAELLPISLSEIHSTLVSEIPKSDFGAITITDVIAVRGEDAPILPMRPRIIPTEDIVDEAPLSQQPRVNLDDIEISRVCERHPNLSRRYLLFHDVRWNGELILTHVVRTNLQGRTFYIETSRFVLTPPSKEFKAIDRKTFRYDYDLFNLELGKFLASAIASPLIAIAAAYNLFASITLWRSSNSTIRSYNRSLKEDPIYNYGSDESIRREMMDAQFDHFSQKADLDFAEKAFDQTIVELIFGYMEEHGVDISDLRNKVMTINNSGIIVQGGDVTAQAMAVGQGASAQSAPIVKNPLNTKAQAS